jgi:hypothetical protein
VNGEAADDKLKARNAVSNALTALLPAYVRLVVKKELILFTICTHESITMDHHTICDNALFTL